MHHMTMRYLWVLARKCAERYPGQERAVSLSPIRSAANRSRVSLSPTIPESESHMFARGG